MVELEDLKKFGIKSSVQSLERLKAEISFFDSLVTTQDYNRKKVSQWSVHKQIEHVLIVNIKVLDLILSPENWVCDGKRKTLLGHIALRVGTFPRGKAKAPKIVQPEGKDIAALLSEAKKRISKTTKALQENIPNNDPVQEHPYFGSLSIKDWLRMLEIHQRHHIKIIKDILKKKPL